MESCWLPDESESYFFYESESFIFCQPGGRAVGFQMKVKVYFFMKAKVLFSVGEPLVAS